MVIASVAIIVPLAVQQVASARIKVHLDADASAVDALHFDGIGIAFDFKHAEAVSNQALFDGAEREGLGGGALRRRQGGDRKAQARGGDDGTDGHWFGLPLGRRAIRAGSPALCQAAPDNLATQPVSVASAAKWQDYGVEMRPARRLLFLFGLAALLAPTQADAHGDRGGGRGRGRGGDHDEAREAYEHGQTLSLSRILRLALRAVPGEVLEVELDRRHGRLVYEIEILARTGRVRKVILDARTGAVLGVEDDR